MVAQHSTKPGATTDGVGHCPKITKRYDQLIVDDLMIALAMIMYSCKARRSMGTPIGINFDRHSLLTDLMNRECAIRRHKSLRRPSLDRGSRLSAFKYSICAAACRSSQQPMLGTSGARKVRGFHAIGWCSAIRSSISRSSFRTIRQSPSEVVAGRNLRRRYYPVLQE